MNLSDVTHCAGLPRDFYSNSTGSAACKAIRENAVEANFRPTMKIDFLQCTAILRLSLLRVTSWESGAPPSQSGKWLRNQGENRRNLPKHRFRAPNGLWPSVHRSPRIHLKPRNRFDTARLWPRNFPRKQKRSASKKFDTRKMASASNFAFPPTGNSPGEAKTTLSFSPQSPTISALLRLVANSTCVSVWKLSAMPTTVPPSASSWPTAPIHHKPSLNSIPMPSFYISRPAIIRRALMPSIIIGSSPNPCHHAGLPLRAFSFPEWPSSSTGPMLHSDVSLRCSKLKFPKLNLIKLLFRSCARIISQQRNKLALFSERFFH
jgi:hypothetical protein